MSNNVPIESSWDKHSYEGAGTISEHAIYTLLTFNWRQRRTLTHFLPVTRVDFRTSTNYHNLPRWPPRKQLSS
jgi:hypothetical protein